MLEVLGNTESYLSLVISDVALTQCLTVEIRHSCFLSLIGSQKFSICTLSRMKKKHPLNGHMEEDSLRLTLVVFSSFLFSYLIRSVCVSGQSLFFFSFLFFSFLFFLLFLFQVCSKSGISFRPNAAFEVSRDEKKKKKKRSDHVD
ncbi:hypothetical protein QBC38DRAFT_162335 [Podospora fimiseda]|uniref:Transmembrane protein n=1 Tax=Podospora fimiseda TaxID=252190 RepID=A0AAN7BSG8_9PEZI|nr:hypothetical protein QBC38DRAFT_162335 [Podospora fimiseda]